MSKHFHFIRFDELCGKHFLGVLQMLEQKMLQSFEGSLINYIKFDLICLTFKFYSCVQFYVTTAGKPGLGGGRREQV